MMQLKDAIQMFTFSEERAGLGLKFSPYALLWLEQWKNDLLANYLLTNKEKNKLIIYIFEYSANAFININIPLYFRL